VVLSCGLAPQEYRKNNKTNILNKALITKVKHYYQIKKVLV